MGRSTVGTFRGRGGDDPSWSDDEWLRVQQDAQPDKRQPFRLNLGFSAAGLLPCDRCGAEANCGWINMDDQRRRRGGFLVSVYLCRACLAQAIRRTFQRGTLTDAEWMALKPGPEPDEDA